MNKYFLLLFFLPLFPATGKGQTIRKLTPDGNTVIIIGSRLSVNYDNNQSSETVNTKNNVFDGDFDTFFASYDRSNTWVGLDLGEKHIITRIAYSPRRDWESRLLLGLFEGANEPDFGDAVPLGIIKEQPLPGLMTGQEISHSRGYRYVRYIGPHEMRCNIAELEFYGYPGEGDNSRLTQLTNIPDVIIHTVSGRDITSKSTYIKGIISFISHDGEKVQTDSLEIRGRGNASWGFAKKPYRIKLYTKAKVLDNPAEARNWTLISNHGDKTLMRNLLAFDLSRRLEMPYTPAGQPVNLFLNGEYKGCYQLCDHIDVRKNRVDVKEMKTTDIAGENLTGGYLVEIDAYADQEDLWFTSEKRRIPVTIKSPDSDEIQATQKTYIQNHFNSWEDAVFSSNYTNPVSGFRKYTDTKTFVRHFLVGEITGNTDTYWSVYLYKQRNDDQFYFGPVWDYDLAYDNDSRTYPVTKPGRTDWLYRSGGSRANGTGEVIDRILSDMELYKELRDTYSYYRDRSIISEEALLKVVDDYASEMEQSQVLNFMRWDIINSWVHMINHNTGSYQGEVNIVRKYIRDRIAWVDNKLSYVPHPVEPPEPPKPPEPPEPPKPPEPPLSLDAPGSPPVRILTGNHALLIDGVREPVFVEIANPTGQTVYKNRVTENIRIPLEKGIYIVRLYSPEKGVSRKTIKTAIH
jgi:hypothetical protein